MGTGTFASPPTNDTLVRFHPHQNPGHFVYLTVVGNVWGDTFLFKRDNGNFDGVRLYALDYYPSEN
ncbi:hypothetical protein GCM10009000_062390 [Halobacterium noricense]|uniref:Uncharacterized protein n=1 Tax=Haladaptatus pallidirubidus TaxID=1008152 RepID=A0AAV3UJG0_9EURY